MKKIIYDFGACRGENFPYYLLKSDLIIAVEANTENCNYIKTKFAKEIDEGKIILETCILSENNNKKEKFYIHKEDYLLGQYPKPNDKNIENFIVTELESKDVITIIKSYGEPYYIKIDLEQYDNVILKRILSNKIIPNYISAEATSTEILDSFLLIGKYKAFKLVEGNNVEYLYKKTEINTAKNKINHSFSKNSAGPFGNDIYGDWIDKNNFIEFMNYKKIGWRDIHCSSIDSPEKEENYKKYINIDNKREKYAKRNKRFSRLISKLNFFNN